MGRKRIYETDQERAVAQRGYDRAYKARKRNDDQAIDRWRARPFIAIDGEGEDREVYEYTEKRTKNENIVRDTFAAIERDGNDRNADRHFERIFEHAKDTIERKIAYYHHYTMLTASNGRKYTKTIEGASLTTKVCFDFLLSLKRDTPNGIFVGFSLNYDFNMMLKDIDLDGLKQLVENGSTFWERYLITWIPSKMFRLSLYERGKKKASETITIYDTFGFFQSSFISTLDKWGIGTAAERNLIYRMKKQRGNFNETDQQDILDYNTLECKLLVSLMDKLREALDTSDLRLTSWHGAGAVGGALLAKHNIHEYIATTPDEQINDAIMRAYFGGRFETLQLGEHYNVTTQDIRSAYPFAFVHLPSTIGQWNHTNSYQNTAWSLWRVKWSLDPQNTINPFPHRHKRRISYPPSGEGWYWYPEVALCLRLYPKAIQVLEGYIFTPGSTDKPFDFLRGVYVERAKFKKSGNNAEKVLKLGMNSVYGKTAQGMTRGKTPKFQSYFWAGYCTSLTRARLYELAMRNPESVIAFATDGVFSTAKLTNESEEQNELGNWETNRLDYLFWAQSGVYFGLYNTNNNDRISDRISRKTRGLGRSEVNFSNLRRQYRNRRLEHTHQTVTIRRFFGLQYCLHINRIDLWRKWIAIEKNVTLMPNSDYIIGSEGRLYQKSYDTLSEPYIIKGKERELDNDDLLEFFVEMDQPLYLE